MAVKYEQRYGVYTVYNVCTVYTVNNVYTVCKTHATVEVTSSFSF